MVEVQGTGFDFARRLIELQKSDGMCDGEWEAVADFCWRRHGSWQLPITSALIAEAPSRFTGESVYLVPEVGETRDGSRLLVVAHAVDLHAIELLDKQLVPLAEQAIKLRRQHLMGHLCESLQEIQDTPKAILEAFTKMNTELEVDFKGSSCPEHYWRCQYQSTVVVVGRAHVYVAGDSIANVILSRNGEDKYLSRSYGVNRDKLEEITGMCYYRKERLTSDDSYVTLSTSRIVKGELTPELITRVEALGLEEAAKQIVGESCMDDNRTLVILPLCHQSREENDGQFYSILEENESEPGELGWVNSLSDPGFVVQPEDVKTEPSTGTEKPSRFNASIRSFYLPGNCMVSYGGRKFQLALSYDHRKIFNENICFLKWPCPGTDEAIHSRLINFLLEDERVTSKNVVVLVHDLRGFSALVAATDRFAFWDRERLESDKPQG